MRGDFARDGFVCTGPLLAAAELEALRAVVTRLLERCAAPVGMARWLSLVQQIRDPEAWDPAFAALRRDPRLRAAAEAALGGPAAIQWQHLVWRAPRCGLFLPWHSDQETWPEPARSRGGVAVWLALDDTDASSGSLQYAPGSHRGLGPDAEAVSTTVPAGAALVHDARIWHASGPNLTDGWRRAVVSVFTSAP